MNTIEWIPATKENIFKHLISFDEIENDYCYEFYCDLNTSFSIKISEASIKKYVFISKCGPLTHRNHSDYLRAEGQYAYHLIDDLKSPLNKKDILQNTDFKVSLQDTYVDSNEGDVSHFIEREKYYHLLEKIKHTYFPSGVNEISDITFKTQDYYFDM